MTALETLAVHYRDRWLAALAWRRSGGRVVGYIGSEFPVELALAAELLPVRLWGDPDADTSIADRYAPQLGPVTRSILQQLLDGRFGFLDLLVIDHSTSDHATVFASLREIERLGQVASLPPFAFLDVARLDREASRRYARLRAAAFRAWLEEVTGTKLNDERLHDAALLRARQRELLIRIAELRMAQPARLSGTDALRVIGAGMVMPPTEHCALLERLIADPPRRSAPAVPRLFVTGSAQDQTGHYEVIERAGAIIVDEDHSWSGRAWDGRAPAMGIAARAADVVSQADRTHADAIVAIGLSGDAGPPWSIPELRRRLAASGLPLLWLNDLPYAAAASTARVTNEIVGLVARLESSGGAHASD